MTKRGRAVEARMRLVEIGGRTAQDLGLGRIVGEILVYLYLQEAECSLDRIEEDLRLSKAAVSTAARQLESLGLLRRVWKRGDRKSYYRTAETMAAALQQGLLGLVRQKADAMAAELERVEALLAEPGAKEDGKDLAFLRGRVQRARVLDQRLSKILRSPLLRIFAR
jgi:DNA-binding transcriptional regulator GbsR (MarR family)